MGHILNNAEKFEAGIAFGCAPPQTKPASKVPRFKIKPGTLCDIRKISSADEWQEYRTKKELGFEKLERYLPDEKCYEFRFQGWVLCVHRSKVKHREDSY